MTLSIVVIKFAYYELWNVDNTDKCIYRMLGPPNCDRELWLRAHCVLLVVLILSAVY